MVKVTVPQPDGEGSMGGRSPPGVTWMNIVAHLSDRDAGAAGPVAGVTVVSKYSYSPIADRHDIENTVCGFAAEDRNDAEPQAPGQST